MTEIPFMLSVNDIIGVPLVLVFFFLLIQWGATKYLQDRNLLKAFYIGLFLRFVGVILSLLFYIFIEKAADTHTYFYYAKTISSAISNSDLSDVGRIFYLDYADLPLLLKAKLPVTTFFADTFTGNKVMIGIAALVSFLSFDSYIAGSIIFSLWGYLGVWLIFYKLVQLYPKLFRYFFIFILCWPSLFFFGSGILKEPLCMGGIGLLFYFAFSKINGLAHWAKILPLIVIALLILYYIKPYLFFSFIIAFIVAWIFSKISQLDYRRQRMFLYFGMIFLFTGSLGAIFFMWNNIIYSDPVRKLMVTIFTITKAQLILGKSGYDLGEIELTPFGVGKYLLQSLIVSLYRPFVYEITKPMLLISGFESLVMLMLTIYTFYKMRFKEILYFVKNSPLLIFCITFTLLVAIQIGAISFNFGTLVRYKMPLMPFFFACFFILLDKRQTAR